MSQARKTLAGLSIAFGLLGGVACADSRADRELAVKVDQELANSPVLGNTQIDVAAEGGVVTLVGVASTEEQVKSAEQLAWSVEGVEAVESRIRVSGPLDAEPPPVGTEPPADAPR